MDKKSLLLLYEQLRLIKALKELEEVNKSLSGKDEQGISTS